MKRLIKRTIVCAVILLLGALPATAQKKKSDVKVNYDKFKDITCAGVDLGIVSSFRQEVVAVGASVSMDASYCTPGQKLEPPSQIGVRFRSKATSWLSGMREGTPNVIFLLDGTRLALRGTYEYVIDNGGTSQITLQVGRDELIQITGSKARRVSPDHLVCTGRASDRGVSLESKKWRDTEYWLFQPWLGSTGNCY